MIYEFKSRATGAVIATQDVAERILRIIGKTPGAKGVILPEQMDAAISALQREIESEKQSGQPAASREPAPKDIDEAREHEAMQVSLAQRAFPFLEMLRRAKAAGKDITWGV